MPAGRPLAVHENGAVPPEALIPRLHADPIVQSSKFGPYGFNEGSRGGTPMTSSDIVLVYDALLVSVAVTLTVNFPGPVLALP